MANAKHLITHAVLTKTWRYDPRSNDYHGEKNLEKPQTSASLLVPPFLLDFKISLRAKAIFALQTADGASHIKYSFIIGNHVNP